MAITPTDPPVVAGEVDATGAADVAAATTVRVTGEGGGHQHHGRHQTSSRRNRPGGTATDTPHAHSSPPDARR